MRTSTSWRKHIAGLRSNPATLKIGDGVVLKHATLDAETAATISEALSAHISALPLGDRAGALVLKARLTRARHGGAGLHVEPDDLRIIVAALPHLDGAERRAAVAEKLTAIFWPDE